MTGDLQLKMVYKSTTTKAPITTQRGKEKIALTQSLLRNSQQVIILIIILNQQVQYLKAKAFWGAYWLKAASPQVSVLTWE